MGYHVSDANSYLVVTGGGIQDVKIVKKAWVWPWQRHSRISISPFDFEITLQAMTVEKLQFSLPAVFTIGPDDHIDALGKYAKILTGKTATNSAKREAAATGRGHVQDIVKGIIEGETRVIVSGMTMEEIFKERQVFKTKVIENVQSELNQFGLRMYVTRSSFLVLPFHPPSASSLSSIVRISLFSLREIHPQRYHQLLSTGRSHLKQ